MVRILDKYNIPCPACQIHYGASQVLRNSPSAGWHSPQYQCLFLFTSPNTLRQLRSNISWRKRSNTDAFPHPLITQRLGELPDSTLRGHVGTDVGAATESKDRGDIDDFLLVNPERV